MDSYGKEVSELSIIGGCIVFPEKLDLIRDLDYFMFSGLNRDIFKEIKTLWSNGQVITLDILKVLLSESKQGYLIQYDTLLKEAISAAYPFDLSYIIKFKEDALLRRADEKLKLLKNLKYNEMLQSLEKIREEMIITSTSIKDFHPGSFLEKRLSIMDRRERIKKVFFGFPGLDELIPGGQSRKEISVIASRPSIGKSLIKANLIKMQCELGFRVASIATEQTEEIETDRIDSLLTKIPTTELSNSRTWKEGDLRIDKVIKANKHIDKNWKYHLRVDRNFSTVDVSRWLRKIVNKYGEVDVCYIDLFDKLVDVNVSEFKASVVGKKLGYLNQVAEELNTHICLLVQINREVRNSKGHRPKIWHIKDSGAYEEVARLIMLLHRESYYNPQIRDHVLEVNIAKQSNGPAGEKIVAKLPLDMDVMEISQSEESKFNIF